LRVKLGSAIRALDRPSLHARLFSAMPRAS
jgi:hypothetical protein